MKRRSLIGFSFSLGCVMTLAGCGSANNTVSQQAGNSSLTAPGTIPIVKSGTQQLTIATTDNLYAPKSYTQNLPVFQEMQKKTGVQIKWDVAPSSQYFNNMKIRLASGKDLPDIINLPEDPTTLANEGLILPLDDLITKYAPNIKQFFDQHPDLYKKEKSPDGKLYSIKSISGTDENPYGVLIRQDWLDKLHLQEPRTPDEWFNVLKAFKDQNVNGKGNVIPFSPGDDEQLHGLWIFGPAFGLHLDLNNGAGSGFYPDQNGKIQFDWLQPNAQEFITWLHKLYANGLIDPQFLSNGDSQTLSEITRNLVGATQHYMNNTVRYDDAQKQAGVDADWELALPPAPVGGKGYYETQPPISGSGFGISKDCKDPELAIRLLDYEFATKEGEMFTDFGIEGKSYTMVNGKPQFTDFVAHNPDGLSFEEALRSIGALPVLPVIRGPQDPFDEPKIALEMNLSLVKQQARVQPFLVPSTYMGTLNQAETDQLGSTWTDINTYMDQTLAQFITGQKPIDWNQFTTGLKSMGIDKVIKIRQEQYDRYK